MILFIPIVVREFYLLKLNNMKIIYEEGDLVVCEDNINVPHELANATLELISKTVDNEWVVRCEETVSGTDSNLIGKAFEINQDWFRPR